MNGLNSYHSALEDYLRGVLIENIPDKAGPKTLEAISLLDSEGRTEKFFLSSLMPYKERTVDSLIRESVRQHMSKISFNDMKDIASWLRKIGIEIDSLKNKESIGTMIKRRHKIVHEADANSNSGPGNHYAASINKQTVLAWKAAVVALVELVERALSGTIKANS